MSISKKQRFAILTRDNFTCQYCGARAPDARLHVDHRTSKRDGGFDDAKNLVTACFDCNMGKGRVSWPPHWPLPWRDLLFAASDLDAIAAAPGGRLSMIEFLASEAYELEPDDPWLGLVEDPLGAESW